jgi:hypothetical protein
MSFEQWITRLANGSYSEYGDPEDPFPCVSGKWGCLFLLRVGQAAEHLDAIATASEIQPERFLWRFAYGFEPLVWDVRHSLQVRQRAVAAAPLILESADSVARERGGAYMFWDCVVALRGLRAVPGDEEEMVNNIRTAIQVNLKSANLSIREGAEYGLWHLDART